MGAPIDRVLAALQFAGQLQQSKAQQGLQQQNIQSEIEARKEAAQEARDRLDETKRQFDANLALQQKFADLQHIQLGQQITSNVLEKGLPIPGESVTPNYPSFPGTAGAFPGVGPMPDVTQQPSTYTHTVTDDKGNPIISLTLPDRDTWMQQQAEMQRIANAPGEEAEARKEARKYASEEALTGIREAEQTKRQLATIQAASEERMKTQQMIIDAENARKAMDNATSIRHGMITATGGMSELYPDMFGGKGPNAANSSGVNIGADGQPIVGSKNLPANLNIGLKNLFNGTESLERLEKTNPNMKQMMSTLAGMNNIGSLTDQQMKDLHDIQVSSDALPIIHDLHQMKLDHPLAITMPWFGSAFKDKMDELNSKVGQIAIQQSGSKRQSDADLKRQFQGLAPSDEILRAGTKEYPKLNDYIDTKVKEAQDLVKGLPEAQQKAVLNNYGVYDMQKYKIPDPDAKSKVQPRSVFGGQQPIVPLGQGLNTPLGQAPTPRLLQNPSSDKEYNAILQSIPPPRKPLPSAPVGEANYYDLRTGKYGHDDMRKLDQHYQIIIPEK